MKVFNSKKPRDKNFYLKLEEDPQNALIDLYLTNVTGTAMARIATVSPSGIHLIPGAQQMVQSSISSGLYEEIDFDDKGRIRLLGHFN